MSQLRVYSPTVDERLYFFSGTTPADTFYGYGNVNPASASTSYQEANCATIYFYKDVSTGELSFHLVYNEFNGPAGTADAVLSGLNPNAYIAVQDDPNDSYILDSVNGTLTTSHAWNLNTDGYSVSGILPEDNLSLSITSYTGLTQFKLINSFGEATYIDLATTTTLDFDIEEIPVTSLINMIPTPGQYLVNEVTVNADISDEVQHFVMTTGTIPPVLSQYVAFDTLDPPNPMTAVVDDGIGGRVVIDGVFTRIYNRNWGNWSTFGAMTGSFKFVYNIINWILDPSKIAAGNRNILIVNDRDRTVTSSYTLNTTGTVGFMKSVNGIANLLNLTVSIVDKSNYGGGNLDFDYNFLKQFAGVWFIGSSNTANPIITERAVEALLTYQSGGGGIYFVTDHGNRDTNDYTDPGYYRTVNEVTRFFGARCWGFYQRPDVPVGHIRDTYGDHPLFQNIPDNQTIEGGGSTSEPIIDGYPQLTAFPEDVIIGPTIKTYNFLITTTSGDTTRESYTYILNETPAVEIEDKDPLVTINSRVPLNLLVNLPAETISGLIKSGQYVVGEFNRNQVNAINSDLLYDFDGLVPIVPSGTPNIQSIEPFSFVESRNVSRPFIDITNILSSARICSTMRQYELEEKHPLKLMHQFQDNIGIENDTSMAINFRNFRFYMNGNLAIQIPAKVEVDSGQTISVPFSNILGNTQVVPVQFVEVTDTLNCTVTTNGNSIDITPTVTTGNFARVKIKVKDANGVFYKNESIFVEVK